MIVAPAFTATPRNKGHPPAFAPPQQRQAPRQQRTVGVSPMSMRFMFQFSSANQPPRLDLVTLPPYGCVGA